jgi:hypothetical protein
LAVGLVVIGVEDNVVAEVVGEAADGLGLDDVVGLEDIIGAAELLGYGE